MKVVEDKTFTGVVIKIDGTRYIRCAFTGCTIQYSGGFYEIIDCKFSPDTRVEFKDAAMRTAALLGTMGMIRQDRPQFFFDPTKPVN